MTPSNRPLPVEGCFVRRSNDDSIGLVNGHDDGRCSVRWISSGLVELIRPGDLRSGFKLGWEVQDVPHSRARRTLGEGLIVGERHIGGRDQVLVQFYENAVSLWIPYENVRRVRGIKELLDRGEIATESSAERLRLRLLAVALERWNAHTGSLAHLDIDPLPHQIHLVHHILSSGSLNWLIADDVGLGKTIETGMLLAALDQDHLAERVLLVVPAALTRQWQEELVYKFGLDDFQVYGRDFEIHESSRWRLHDRVIASIDRLKTPRHLDLLTASGKRWDMIVFDEAHRLTRRQYGLKYKMAERFTLAAQLRNTTDNLILLTGTPHQGRADQFSALLELLRPEWAKLFDEIEQHPNILGDVVYRNRKADVTDSDGNFLFHGRQTIALSLESDPAEQEFDRTLRAYIRRGYGAARGDDPRARAIGFVMTVYRKLAASSLQAIATALRRRQLRLETGVETNSLPGTDEDEDGRYSGEREEAASEGGAAPFFEGEFEQLANLVKTAEALTRTDRKLSLFLDEVMPRAIESSPTGKVLIFTEYRATQSLLQDALGARHGPTSCTVINGDLNLDEKREASAAFNSEGQTQFLISTEAGGEGINLHSQCSVMVNYDLPWNPMRLVQRLGRIYRYGQKRPVLVFNLRVPQSLDSEIVDIMYEKLGEIVETMSGVSEEFDSRTYDEVLGEMASLVDLDSVLQDASNSGLQRTEKRIQVALDKARQAQELQEKVLSHAHGFDRRELDNEIRLTPAHVMAFIRGMLKLESCEILEERRGGRVLEIRLSDEVRDGIGIRRSRLAITAERRLSPEGSNIEVMDARHPLLRHLLVLAQTFNFGGRFAAVREPDAGAIVGALLRWQNDQGRQVHEELEIYLVDENGDVTTNHSSLADRLEKPWSDGQVNPSRQDRRELLRAALVVAEANLASHGEAGRHPLQIRLLAAGVRG